jgi:hypothetical protein
MEAFMKRTPRVCFAIVVLVLSADVARADVVTDWNAIAVQTIGSLTPASHARPGRSAILDFATVHAAIHDAIQALIQGPRNEHVVRGRRCSRNGRARGIRNGLRVRFVTMLECMLHDYLNARGLLGDPGVGVGQEAASRVLATRGTIGTYPYPPDVFNGGTGPGEWRPTLPAFASMAAPWLGDVQPFALKDSSQLGESTPPFQLGSGEYTREFEEVKSLGRLNSPDRTPQQNALALFYLDNFLTLWQRTLRTVVPAHVSDVGDSARTFALANIAADKNDFLVTSAIAGTTPIQYHRFSAMADDVVDVRVYQGIHFRRADVVGRRQGKRSADWTVSHVLKPTN